MEKTMYCFYIRIYNSVLHTSSEVDFYSKEKEAILAFNTRAATKAKKHNQPFYRCWVDNDGITWCDFGSWVWFLQMGKIEI
jgi:hypothetical protein